MISARPIRNGVIGFLLVAVTPFLFEAEAQQTRSPVEVESLTESENRAPARGETRAGSERLAEEPDMRPASPEEIPFQPPIEDEPGEGGAPAAFDTQYRLQVLQQEVQELRGLIEELSYQLRRMQSTQEDRYLELDGRFQNLQSQINRSAGSAGDPTGGQTGGEDLANVDEIDEPVIAGSGDERELYETSLELIRNRQYNSAIGQLRALIEGFPDGDFTANAYYWLGEVYAAKPEPEYELARQALAQVIEFFPEHRKVADAAFKLGKVHHLMGNCEASRDILEQVRADYSGKSVANLADAYLRDKVDCGS